MFGYVYLVRNKVNGKQYIGQKHSDTFVEDYYGSGVYLKRAINKYGVDNFEHVKILEWCKTKEDLDKSERYWIDYYNAVESCEFYNLAKGGVGTTAGSRRSDTWKSKMSVITSKRVWKDESRKKISDSVSGRVWVNNSLVEKQVTVEECNKLLSEGFVKGRLPFSEEHLKRMSESRSGISYETEESRLRKSITLKGEGNHFYGKHHSEEQKQKWSKLRREMVWVNKDGKNTVIHCSKLQDYLDDGWVRGMIKSKKSSTTIESVGNEKDITE